MTLQNMKQHVLDRQVERCLKYIHPYQRKIRWDAAPSTNPRFRRLTDRLIRLKLENDRRDQIEIDALDRAQEEQSR